MGAIFGALGGVAYTAITSGGTASKEQYTEAAIIGALPFGLGMRGAAKGLNKARRLRGVRKHFDSKTAFALSIGDPIKYGRWSLRPEAKAIGTGILANYAVRSFVGSGRKGKSNRVSGRKNGLGGPVRGPKATNRFARRRRKLIPRTGRKCPNGYRYDAKRKMCVYKGL